MFVFILEVYLQLFEYFTSFQMTKSRYNPKYKIKLQNQIPKDIKSSNLPQNLQSFKDKLFSGNGFIVYK